MPSAISAHHPAIRELCAALGLERVRSLVIRVAVDEAVTVEVEKFVTDDEAGELLRVISEHELVLGPDSRLLFVPEEVETGEDVSTISDMSREYAP